MAIVFINYMEISKIYLILNRALEGYTIPLAEQIQVKTKKPFFVLVGAMLSSRTKDEVTAKVCDRLFTRVKSFKDIREIDVEELEKLVYGVGFYRTKAKNLKKMAESTDRVPDNIDELVELSGVGRKTANLVVSVAFNKPAICVDTHVHRIMNRIGYIRTKTPEKTEFTLRKKLPKELWQQTNYLFVILGQNICAPISPFCSKCPIEKECKKVNVTIKR